jgi:SpoU rRNA methylase family enzyme
MASRNLGSLTVDLLLKMGGFTQGMDRAARESDRAVKRMQASFGKVTKALGAIGVGVSLVGVTSALGRAAAQAIEYGDEINKAAQKTGVSVEAFSELAYAAKQADIDMAALGTAFKKMQQSISEAASGTKSAQEIFAALQIDFEALRSLKPEQQFELIAEQISRIRDPADKTRAAVELFGKAGAELLPMFEEGAAGIRKAREEAVKLGAALTTEQAEALAEADDAIKRLGQAWDGVARSLTVAVAPALTSALKAMENVLAKEPRVLSLAEAWGAVARAFKENGIWTSNADILREIQNGPPATRRSNVGLPPGGRNRLPTPIDFKLPEDPAKPKKSGRSAADSEAARAAREAAAALERQASAYEDVLKQGMAAIEGLRTPTEAQIALDNERRFALENLAATYPNLASEAEEALKRLSVEGLDEIVITAEHIFPEPERTKLSVFMEEAGRNFQNLLADFLFDPFSDGIDGMLKSFGEMLQRMAAQAIAADIAGKIFGSSAGGVGAGMLGSLLGAFTGGAGSGLDPIVITAQRLAGGGLVTGPGSGTSDSILARLSNREYVMPAAAVARPGVLSMLESVRAGLPKFAAGGLVGTGGSGYGANVMRAMTAGIDAPAPMMVTNNFNISAPTGTVSRQTQQQIAASAARGLASAARRNN